MATSKSTSAKKPAATKPATGKTAATGKATPKALTGKTATKKVTAIVKKPATPLSKTAPATAPKKAAAPARTSAAKAVPPNPEQRYRMIQEAAYYLAEKHGFAGGAMDYWIAAEAEIDVLLSGKKKK